MVRVRHIWPALLLIAAATARSSPGEYWVRYDAADGLYPEQEPGWQRYTLDGGDQRYFQDRRLVIDGMADPNAWDAYIMDRTINPGRNEVYVMRWRLEVDQLRYDWDPMISVYSDDHWSVYFVLSLDRIYSVDEGFRSAPFEPFVAHTFEFRSVDMRAYTLAIDGSVALEGTFWNSLGYSNVAWGDGVSGGASLARWDFFEFGTVPECQSIAYVAAAALLLARRRKRGCKPCQRVHLRFC